MSDIFGWTSASPQVGNRALSLGLILTHIFRWTPGVPSKSEMLPSPCRKCFPLPWGESVRRRRFHQPSPDG